MRCLWYSGWAIDPAWLALRLGELPWPEGFQPPDIQVAPIEPRERAAWTSEFWSSQTPHWWCGWSMGGLRAIEMAADDPRCEGVIVLAGTPCFCVNPQWHFAISNNEWHDLLQRWAKQPKQTLKRFYRMISAGDTASDFGANLKTSGDRTRVNTLVTELLDRGSALYTDCAALLDEELRWLRSVDVRELVQAMQKPIVFLVAEQDPLLPAEHAEALCALGPHVRVQRLNGVGHVPFYGLGAQRLASALATVLTDADDECDAGSAAQQQVSGSETRSALPSLSHDRDVKSVSEVDAILKKGQAAVTVQEKDEADRVTTDKVAPEPVINRRAIEGFGAAAAHYIQGSALQRCVARALLEQGPITAMRSASQILDLGSGSGYIGEYWRNRWGARSDWCLTGLDGSTAMLAEAARRLPDSRLRWCHGYLENPAASLPREISAWDVVVSNFALHWVASPTQALAAWVDVLRPGGWLGVAVPMVGSLSELISVWAQIDRYQHTVQFPEWTEILKWFVDQSGVECQWWQQRFYTEYQDLKHLRANLSAIGAAALHSGGRKGLMTPRQWHRLQAHYDRLRTGRGRLPLSYEVGFIWWRKPLLGKTEAS